MGRRTCDERHAKLLRGGLVACPGKAHEGYVVQLRHSDDRTGQREVARRHPIHRAVRLDLFVGVMNMYR